MMLNRLHVREITSIGAIEDGKADNPAASIVLWKAKPPVPSPGENAPKGRRVSTAPPADWGSVVAKVRLDAMDEDVKELHKTIDDSRRTMNEIREMRGEPMVNRELTAEGIAKAVHARAEALRSKPEHWDRTEVELRAELWKRTPGLKDCYTAAMSDPDAFSKSKTNEHSEALRTISVWKSERA